MLYSNNTLHTTWERTRKDTHTYNHWTNINIQLYQSIHPTHLQAISSTVTRCLFSSSIKTTTEFSFSNILSSWPASLYWTMPEFFSAIMDAHFHCVLPQQLRLLLALLHKGGLLSVSHCTHWQLSPPASKVGPCSGGWKKRKKKGVTSTPYCHSACQLKPGYHSNVLGSLNCMHRGQGASDVSPEFRLTFSALLSAVVDINSKWQLLSSLPQFIKSQLPVLPNADGSQTLICQFLKL